MEKKLKGWESENETRALLLRYCDLEDEIRERRSDVRYLHYKKQIVLNKKGDVRIGFERWETEEKEQKEKISGIEEKLKIMHAELKEDQDLREFVKGRCKGIICDTADEVRAVHRLQFYTFEFQTCAGVYLDCPNIEQILPEAERWRVRAMVLTGDESGNAISTVRDKTTNARAGNMAPPFINWEAQTRSKLLAVVGLEKEIEYRIDHLRYSTRRRMEKGFELERLQDEEKEFETLKANCKEFIKNGEEDLKTLKGEIKQKNLKETLLRKCGEGMLCENRDDVRAFYTMMKLNGNVKEVFVDAACPNYKEVVQAASERMLPVHPIGTSSSL